MVMVIQTLTPGNQEAGLRNSHTNEGYKIKGIKYQLLTDQIMWHQSEENCCILWLEPSSSMVDSVRPLSVVIHQVSLVMVLILDL